ncbi:uncharacterized protein ARMOST_13663 [Armillaria ostoyae]|uniref:Uncharacterized protein n=1 Tax=Armillaria ostoyae TaxID=47428 RepID=A0A284RND6_ARMOS|nr:uncharacterized protein ARMOST_13663 [Armillaria ostoyae]
MLAELPDAVETILTLATTFQRTSLLYELFDRTQRRPFTSYWMLCLSFIYKLSSSVIHASSPIAFTRRSDKSNDLSPPSSIWACLRASYPLHLNAWIGQSVPTRLQVAFFEDLKKLVCKTINMYNPDPWLLDALRARTSEIIVFDLPVLTELSKVTLSECPGQFIAWMLRCIEESPVAIVLLQINEFSLNRSHSARSVRGVFNVP